MVRELGPVKLRLQIGEEEPPPTRDSEPGSSQPGPHGEVVVPNLSTRDSGGGREGSVPASSPDLRLREKTRLKAMTPLTVLEQQIEELAVEYDTDERYDEPAVLQIYSLLERTRLQGSKAVNRRSQTASTSWTTGMFTHGGITGLRRTTRRMPATTAFLVKSAKELMGEHGFGVVAVTRGAQLKAHRDSHNDASIRNTVMALNDFQGGGLWVEGPPGDQWREVTPGRWTKGKTYELRPGIPFSFNPKKWHETQPFQGDRVVMMTYTPRSSSLSDEDQQELWELGFDVPEEKKFPVTTEAVKLQKQEYILEEDGALETFVKMDAVEEEHGEMDQSFLKINELQQQVVDEMMDRSSLLQDLVEEEEERLQDLHQTQYSCLETTKQIHGEIMQMLDSLTERLRHQQQVRDEMLVLKAAIPEPDQDYEKLLAELEGDLQVTHTVPLQQVRPVVERWQQAIQKEVKNLCETGTLRKIKKTEAKRREAEGKLRLVPSKGYLRSNLQVKKGAATKGNAEWCCVGTLWMLQMLKDRCMQEVQALRH